MNKLRAMQQKQTAAPAAQPSADGKTEENGAEGGSVFSLKKGGAKKNAGTAARLRLQKGCIIQSPEAH
jgi:hypothetical protein